MHLTVPDTWSLRDTGQSQLSWGMLGLLCTVDARVPQAHPVPSTGEAEPWGASWPVPAQKTSELEYLQIHDTGLTAPEAPRTAGPAPGSSLGAHRTARRRLPDRGVSATPDCPLHRNIYLFSHSTLELPGASAPPPPEAGQEVQRTQPGWGQPDWQDLRGQGPSLFSEAPQPPTGASSLPQPVCPCPGLGRGEGNFVGNKLHSVDLAAVQFAAPKQSPGLGPQVCSSSSLVV